VPVAVQLPSNDRHSPGPPPPEEAEAVPSTTARAGMRRAASPIERARSHGRDGDVLEYVPRAHGAAGYCDPSGRAMTSARAAPAAAGRPAAASSTPEPPLLLEAASGPAWPWPRLPSLSPFLQAAWACPTSPSAFFRRGASMSCSFTPALVRARSRPGSAGRSRPACAGVHVLGPRGVHILRARGVDVLGPRGVHILRARGVDVLGPRGVTSCCAGVHILRARGVFTS
jgi:hypothetical protein